MNILKTTTALKAVSLAAIAALATACATTQSADVASHTSAQAEDVKEVIFPDMADAWLKTGVFANVDNVNNVHQGITKDGLYHLIGRPHFNEGFNSKEWDYILKFKNQDGSTEVCQYKVLFDNNYTGQEFYWSSEGCKDVFTSKVDSRSIAVPAATINYSQPDKERVSFSSDALFSFDGYKVSDMLPEGRNEVRMLAEKLKEHQDLVDLRVVVTGHTDRLGDDKYNTNLSQLRAQTVRKLLIDNGVDPRSIIAVGAGESEPLKDCPTNLSRQQAVSCLSPNRRVVVDFSAYK